MTIYETYMNVLNSLLYPQFEVTRLSSVIVVSNLTMKGEGPQFNSR